MIMNRPNIWLIRCKASPSQCRLLELSGNMHLKVYLLKCFSSYTTLYYQRISAIATSFSYANITLVHECLRYESVSASQPTHPV